MLLKITASIKWLLATIAMAMFIAPTPSSAYTHDELLPDYISTFQSLNPGVAYLYNYHRASWIGVSGANFPTAWETISTGEDLRLRILLPPGMDFASIYVESPTMVARFGVCDGVPAICNTSMAAPSMLWPIGAAAKTVLTSPREISLVVSANEAAFTFATMTISYHIADINLYEAWRRQRNWAGGAGDCDGLGNAYCNGAAPTTAFSIAASSQQISAGGAFILTASNGAIGSCVSSNPAVVPNPMVNAGGASASGVAVSAAAANSQVTITCTSTASSTASTILTVTNPTFSLTPSSQQAAAGASYALSAQNGVLSFCSSSNPTAFPAPVINWSGSTATGSIAPGAAAGSQTTITCASSTAATATATVSVSPPTSGLSLTIQTPSAAQISGVGAALTATASGAATAYWVALPYADTAPAQPAAEQIKNDLDAGGMAVPAKGMFAMAANTANQFSLTNLTANTNYQVFIYAEDALGNRTSVQTITFRTMAVMSGFTLNCPATLIAGTGGACSAAASYSDGSSKAVAPASWTSSSSDILAVSSSSSGSGGQLTANKPGTAKICASFSENGTTLSQCADVTVSAPATLVLPAPLIVVAGENQSIAPTSGKAVYCYASPDTLTVSLDKNTNTIALSAAGAASGKALLTCVDSGGISAKADVTLYPEGTLQIPAPSPMETGDSRDIAIIGTPTDCTAGIPGIVSTAPRQNGLKLQALKPGKTDLTCINARSRSSVVPITVNTKYPLQDAKLVHAGALVNDVARMENPLTLTARDNASLQLALNVPAEHQNKAVEPLLVVVLGKETFVTRTSGGSWSGWDKSPATLPAAGKKLLAGNQLTFNDIYEGVLPAGEYTVFAGYRYDDGSGVVPIVVNLTAPLRIVVKPN